MRRLVVGGEVGDLSAKLLHRCGRLNLKFAPGWHFLENFGAAPIDSKQAIAELERLKERGAGYLVLTRHQPWWWSERYDNFWSYLDSHYARARDAEDYVIFDLGNTEPANWPVVSVPPSKLTAPFQPG